MAGTFGWDEQVREDTMQVRVIVGKLEREIRADTVMAATDWSAEPDADQPLAEDERTLLEELTRLCHRVLLDDAPPHPFD